jgi:hypothetical protein
MSGREPDGSGATAGRSPQGQVGQVVCPGACKALVYGHWEFDSLPAHSRPRGAVGQRGSFRRSRSSVRIGSGMLWRASRWRGGRSAKPPLLGSIPGRVSRLVVQGMRTPVS